MLKALLILLVLLCSVSCGRNYAATKKPKAVRGTLDLQSWDFSRNGPVELNGEWEFYWDEYIIPNDFIENNQPGSFDYVKIPLSWNKYKFKDKNITGKGKATFRLNVKLSRKDKILAIRVGNVLTAYNLWINGNIIISNGTTGNSITDTKPDSTLRTAYFKPERDTEDIIIHAANYHYCIGGVSQEIIIGTPEQLNEYKLEKSAYDLVLFGCIFIIGLYHFFLFFVRRQDKSTVFFGVFCIDVAVYALLLGERLFYIFFPYIPWEISFKILHLSWQSAPVLFLIYLKSVFTDIINKIVYRLCQLVWIIAVSLILFTPARIYSCATTAYQVFLLIVGLYNFYILARACVKKREGAVVMCAGYLVILISAFNDVFYYQDLIYSIYLLPFGLFVFIFSQSAVISLKFSKAFKTIEKMKYELDEKNKKLLRIDRIKDEFLANTSHELKTPLNGIIGLADSISGRLSRHSREKIRNDLSLISASGRSQ